MMSMMMRPAQTTVKKYWMRKDSNEEAVVAGRKQLVETTKTMMILTWRSLRMMPRRQDRAMTITMKHHHLCRSKTVSVSLAALQTRMCTNTSVKVRKAQCPANSKVSTSKVSCRITRSAV